MIWGQSSRALSVLCLPLCLLVLISVGEDFSQVQHLISRHDAILGHLLIAHPRKAEGYRVCAALPSRGLFSIITQASSPTLEPLGLPTALSTHLLKLEKINAFYGQALGGILKLT